jgi:hypothetical protein
MTKKELLLDTIEYYSIDRNRRCELDNSCKYSPKSAGKKGISEGCAIGRHLSEETKEFYDKQSVSNIRRTKSTCS